MSCVYCHRCGAVFAATSGRDDFRASQDHEIDEHPDGWGATVYERLTTVR